MKAIKNLSMFFVGLIFLSACSSTKITSSWKAPDVSNINSSVETIMVAALLPDRYRELESLMEKQLVRQLQQKGFKASSAYEMYGPKYFPSNEKEALEKFKETGVDAVLTIVLLDKNKERRYIPRRRGVAPVGIYRNWYGYYSTVYRRVYTPGYYSSATSFYWETNFYDLTPEKLLYSAQSESFDPSSVSQLAMDYANKIIKDMAKQGLVSKK